MPNIYTLDLNNLPTLQAGDTLQIPWNNGEPWAVKIPICYDNITIRGLLGPQGQRPILTAADAVELPYPGFFSEQVHSSGLITVAPPNGFPFNNPQISNFLIDNLILQDCNQNSNGFRAGDGTNTDHGWTDSSAGIAAYLADYVKIRNCEISQCGNGIFGKCQSEDINQLLKRVLVANCHVHDNGAFADGHKHNIYVECMDFELRGSHVHDTQTGGVSVKTRCAVAHLDTCWIENGAYCLDLVEPDDGGQGLKDLANGRPHIVTGCVIINRESAETAWLFGYDQVQALAPELCLASFNTVININDSITDKYDTCLYKVLPGSTLRMANSLHMLYSPNTDPPGDLYLATGDVDGGGTLDLSLGGNWFPNLTKPPIYGVVEMGFAQQFFGDDPLLVDPLNGNLQPSSGSPVRGHAVALPASWLKPTHEWVMAHLQKRAAANDIGAIES